MACGICKPFSTPPFLPHRRRTPKEAKKEELLGRLSPVDAPPSEPTPTQPLNLNRLISLDLAMPWECVADLVRPDQQCRISVSRCLTSISGMSTVIFGYWIGPDIEDGWGYVEATLDRIL
uniref:Uncharacterized protein n=1 Tax=Ananas comosus var. bracteatus TaxID=296719 RepID=A0A6V7PC89_ANACO|nr:unnamed protein product [Ananas comosus var. bracteatus]